MANKPAKPNVPPPPLRSQPATFSQRAEASLQFWEPFAQYMDDMGLYMQQTANEAAASAASAGGGTALDRDGNAGRVLSVKADETGMEFSRKIPASEIVGTTDTQSLRNKTLHTPVIQVGGDSEGDLYQRGSDGRLYRILIGAENDVLSCVNGIWVAWPAGVPVGSIIFAASVQHFNGYLPANGAWVSRTQYSRLFNAIGGYYGAGNGSTSFTLPDLRGEFIRGKDDGRGLDPGRGWGQVQGSSISNHAHHSSQGSEFPSYGWSGNATAPTGAHVKYNGLTSGVVNGGAVGENRPRNFPLRAWIRF